jgi:tetratricopeptide (TPR) repeat protein
VSGPLDLVLFVATPLLVVPAVAALQDRWTSAQLYLFVASFGAIGHHLPGMLRAYGDRALFARFRTRFVIAPLLLVAGCVLLAFKAKAALVLAAFAWGSWHGAMQVHGFARIYDAKAGSVSRLTAHLDQALMLSWFATALAWSDLRVHYLVDHALQSGLPVPEPATVTALRLGVFVATAAVTLAWIARAGQQWRAGTPPSPIKVALQVTTIAFYAYANLVVSDLLIAVVLFEIFHDVQYLSIVWLFNRKRADSGAGAGAFTRWLFRPRAALLVVYVGLCFAYGSLNYVGAGLPESAIATVLAGVLAASGFLHFYFDGFIWKLREAQTRAGLGIAGGSSAASGRRLPAALLHGAAWAVFFAVPLGVMAAATGRALPADERHLALAAALPDDPGAQRNAAIALAQRGDRDAALASARRARTLALSRREPSTQEQVDATLAALLSDAALAEARAGRLPEAASLLRDALPLAPSAADPLSDEAAGRLAAGDARGAEALCRALLAAAPDHGVAHHNLAAALAAQGRLPEARGHAARAVELMPGQEQPRAVLRRLDDAIAGR